MTLSIYAIPSIFIYLLENISQIENTAAFEFGVKAKAGGKLVEQLEQSRVEQFNKRFPQVVREEAKVTFQYRSLLMKYIIKHTLYIRQCATTYT